MGILSRLETQVARETSRLDQLSEKPLETWIEKHVALHALQIQAQALLDMVTRMASELGYSPTSPSEAIRILQEEGVLEKNDAVFLNRLAGFRDILVQEYAEVDMELIKNILKKREYRKAAILAAKLLEKAVDLNLDP